MPERVPCLPIHDPCGFDCRGRWAPLSPCPCPCSGSGSGSAPTPRLLAKANDHSASVNFAPRTDSEPRWKAKKAKGVKFGQHTALTAWLSRALTTDLHHGNATTLHHVLAHRLAQPSPHPPRLLATSTAIKRAQPRPHTWSAQHRLQGFQTACHSPRVSTTPRRKMTSPNTSNRPNSSFAGSHLPQSSAAALNRANLRYSEFPCGTSAECERHFAFTLLTRPASLPQLFDLTSSRNAQLGGLPDHR